MPELDKTVAFIQAEHGLMVTLTYNFLTSLLWHLLFHWMDGWPIAGGEKWDGVRGW